MAALSRSLHINVWTGPVARNCGTRSRRTVRTQDTEWESRTRRADAVNRKIGSRSWSEVVIMLKRVSGFVGSGFAEEPSFSTSNQC